MPTELENTREALMHSINILNKIRANKVSHTENSPTFIEYCGNLCDDMKTISMHVSNISENKTLKINEKNLLAKIEVYLGNEKSSGSLLYYLAKIVNAKEYKLNGVEMDVFERLIKNIYSNDSIILHFKILLFLIRKRNKTEKYNKICNI